MLKIVEFISYFIQKKTDWKKQFNKEEIFQQTFSIYLFRNKHLHFLNSIKRLDYWFKLSKHRYADLFTQSLIGIT